MKPRTHDPQRLDVEAFAADGASLEGGWPLAGFARLIDGQPAEAALPAGRWWPTPEALAAGLPAPVRKLLEAGPPR